MTELEPETRHLSSEALREQLAKLRDEEPRPTAEHGTRFVSAALTPQVDEDAPTRLRPRFNVFALGPSASHERTATAIDVASLRAVASPRRGTKTEATPPTAADAIAHEPQGARVEADQGTGTARFDAAPLRRELSVRRAHRQRLRMVVGALVALASITGIVVAQIGASASQVRAPGRESTDPGAHAPSIAQPLAPAAEGQRARQAVGAPPPAAPGAATHALSQRTAREAVPSTAVGANEETSASAPSISAHAPSAASAGARGTRSAADLLLSGRTRAALDAYRALAMEPGAPAVFATITTLLERELTACREEGGEPCAHGYE